MQFVNMNIYFLILANMVVSISVTASPKALSSRHVDALLRRSQIAIGLSRNDFEKKCTSCASLAKDCGPEHKKEILAKIQASWKLHAFHLKAVGFQHNLKLIAKISPWKFRSKDGHEPTSIDIKTLRGKKVVSVGEGISPLMPFLALQGVDIEGLDICYDEHGGTKGCHEHGKEEALEDRACFEKRNRLGDATRMDASYAKESVDVIIANDMVCELERSMVKDMLKTSAEVLKIEGFGRFNSLHDHSEAELRKIIAEVVEEQKDRPYSLKFEFFSISTDDADFKNRQIYLIEMRKTKKH